MYDDFLFDMWYLEAEENEHLKDEIEDLEYENDELREELKKRKASEKDKRAEENYEEIDTDLTTYFIEDFQTIASEQ